MCFFNFSCIFRKKSQINFTNISLYINREIFRYDQEITLIDAFLIVYGALFSEFRYKVGERKLKVEDNCFQPFFERRSKLI